MIARMVAALTIAVLIAALASAAPIAELTLPTLKNFYLLASPLRSKAAANATGIDFVDPYYQSNYLLSVQPEASGYTRFNLTWSGTLESVGYLRFGTTPVNYESNVDNTGSVYFLPANGTAFLFSFTLDGFLAFKGDDAHWTQCEGELEQTVIYYKGNDSSCEHIYIFQQTTAPLSP